MARKAQDNPQLDMTPMIDVVFELIIFFVVTLTEAQKKDETIELEDGKHGIVLVPEELPPTHMQIDIASRDKKGKRLARGRISMGDRDMTPDEIGRRVKERMRKVGEFPVLIRADYDVRHADVARVMNACTANGIWKISFMATAEDKRSKPGNPARPHLNALKRRGN
jgi:biopolymer transport protein ExbD